MRRTCSILALGYLLLVTTTAHAASPPWKEKFFAAPARAVLESANRVSLPADTEVVILFEERLHVYGPDGASERRYRQVYQVRSEAAAQGWNSVETNWEPWHEERPKVRARIVAPDGHVFFLDPNTIETTTPRASGHDLYTDRSSLRAPLPGVTRGAVVEVENITRENKPVFDEGSVEGWVFVSGIPVQESRLIVDAPEALPVTFVLNNGEDVNRTETHPDGHVVTTFEGGPWKARDPIFPYPPPELWRSSSVLFSTGRSWKRVAARYLSIVEEQLKGADLRDYARQTTAAAKTRDTRIAAILERLNREIRYTGLEFGAATLVPHPPAEVLSRRFGDCKDKATLLVGLLRAIGIEAHVALLDADVGRDIDARVPGMGGFNHAIVFVPGETPLWIDPTDPYTPMGELPLSDQGRLALVIRPGTNGLVKTPAVMSNQNLTQEMRELTLSEDGTIRLKERTLYKGALAGTTRQRYASLTHEDLDSSLRKYVIDEYQVKDLASWSNSKPDELGKPFTLDLNVEGVSMGSVGGDAVVLPLQVTPLFRDLPMEIRDPEKAASSLPAALKGIERKVDFVYALPYTYELVFRIKPAHGFVVQELPPDEETRLGPGHLTFICRAQSDGTVEARYLFDSGPNRLSPSALAKFQEDFAAYMKGAVQQVKLGLNAEALLQAGKNKEALSAFRTLDKDHTQSAHHAAQLARALLTAGLGEAARKQAKRATDLDAKSSQAYAMLGMVLEHDLLGRVAHPGFDRTGAEEAFKRAIELDPNNVYAHTQLALMAEYDDDGNHTWPASSRGAALARHERHQKLKNHDREFDTNYLITLFRLKRYSEVIAKTKALSTSNSSWALAIASIALTKGTAEAVRQTTVLVPSADDRPEVLRIAASEIMSLQRYPESAALFDEAARGHKNAAGIRLLAATLRHTKRFDKHAIDRRNPGEVARGLMGLMASEGALNLAEVQPLYLDGKLSSPEQTNAEKKAFMRGWQSQTGNLSWSMAVMMDVATSREWTQTGDRRWGVWVHVPEMSPHQGFFMVPRPDGFRFLTAGQRQASNDLGEEAMRLFDKGDREGASYLLDQCEDLFSRQRQTDPVDINPFLSVWQDGNKNDPSVMPLAMTLARPDAKLTPKDEEVLQRCRLHAAEPARTGCEVALLYRLNGDKRYAESRAVAESLLARFPRSEQASHLATQAAMRARDWEAAARLARAAIGRKPDDANSMVQLSEILLRQGKTKECLEQLHKVLETGKAQALAYNQLAWYAMALGKSDATAVDHARQAVHLSQRKDPSYLHTLAAVLADAGKVEEARETLMELLELEIDKQPSAVDWFVVGRIAEQYEDLEAARAAYSKVGTPGPEDIFSTQKLAQQRLRALGPR